MFKNLQWTLPSIFLFRLQLKVMQLFHVPVLGAILRFFSNNLMKLNIYLGMYSILHKKTKVAQRRYTRKCKLGCCLPQKYPRTNRIPCYTLHWGFKLRRDCNFYINAWMQLKKNVISSPHPLFPHIFQLRSLNCCNFSL